MFGTACRAGTLYDRSGFRRGAQSKISAGRKRDVWRRGRAEESGLPEESPHVCKRGCLVSVFDEMGQLSLFWPHSKHFPSSFSTLSYLFFPSRPSPARLMAHLDRSAATRARP